MASKQHIQRLQQKAKSNNKTAKKKLKTVKKSVPADLCKSEDDNKIEIPTQEIPPSPVPSPTEEIEVKQIEPDTGIPQCAVCGSKLKNPASKQHISTKKHQKALEKWLNGPEPLEEKEEEDNDQDEEEEEPSFC